MTNLDALFTGLQLNISSTLFLKIKHLSQKLMSDHYIMESITLDRFSSVCVFAHVNLSVSVIESNT